MNLYVTSCSAADALTCCAAGLYITITLALSTQKSEKMDWWKYICLMSVVETRNTAEKQSETRNAEGHRSPKRQSERMGRARAHPRNHRITY